MEYRVEDLAAAAGVRVDTVRFYQGKGLLPAPRREGRVALYGESHLERLQRIRELLAAGFKLVQIGRLLQAEERAGAAAASAQAAAAAEEPLLAALAAESVGEGSLTLAELAARSGLPEPLLRAARSAGLFEPVVVGGEERFGSADLDLARAALALLDAGFPLDELLQLAVQHAGGVRAVADAAIDLFDEHVIAGRLDEAGAADEIADAFRALLPQVTRMVALHFQRTLLNRALERLRARGDAGPLEQAIAASESVRLDVSWKRA